MKQCDLFQGDVLEKYILPVEKSSYRRKWELMQIPENLEAAAVGVFEAFREDDI